MGSAETCFELIKGHLDLMLDRENHLLPQIMHVDQQGRVQSERTLQSLLKR